MTRWDSQENDFDSNKMSLSFVSWARCHQRDVIKAVTNITVNNFEIFLQKTSSEKKFRFSAEFSFIVSGKFKKDKIRPQKTVHKNEHEKLKDLNGNLWRKTFRRTAFALKLFSPWVTWIAPSSRQSFVIFAKSLSKSQIFDFFEKIQIFSMVLFEFSNKEEMCRIQN